MMVDILIYTKDNCSYCVKAKSLLEARGLQYREVLLGKDILIEKFIEIYPGVRTAPFIVIDGVKIGGFDKLQEWTRQQPNLLLG